MLSGSRLEVSPDVTILKPQLRTVVQFAKPHVSSSVWCTILWLSIDQEIPKQLPAHVRTKYAAGIDTLPWSYTQAAIPELLRHGHDTIISKYFTIPSSATVPYPDLPISFPNLALYLQAALDASRRSPSDSGQRRLAKMIDFCYPTLRLEEDEPSGSVGGLFKKAFARGKLPKSGKKKRGINEDTYELVTPFVPDEWG
ncbi:hypothetical protein FISHEDRAFT_41824 [Fistulina hepatica ATCC 64428]|nr:hypothetical protein FISHEDRAFT_41824 [Fistulina hepatica ATCC 64428]